MTIVGLANGQAMLTLREVYDFKIGDVFEYNSDDWQYSGVSNGYKKTILDKRISKNVDTIIYKIKIDSYDLSFDLSGKDPVRIYTYNSIIEEKLFTQLDSPVCNNFRLKYPRKSYVFEDSVYFLKDWEVDVYKYDAISGAGNFSEIIGKGIGLIEKYNIIDHGWYLENLTYYKKGNLQYGKKDKNYALESETITNKPLSFYPNPVISKIHFSKPLLSNYTISIIDCTGRTVLKRSDFDFEYEMDINSIAKGLYFLKLETTQQTIIKKFIKG